VIRPGFNDGHLIPYDFIKESDLIANMNGDLMVTVCGELGFDEFLCEFRERHGFFLPSIYFRKPAFFMNSGSFSSSWAIS
jgi:hypothetical protein